MQYAQQAQTRRTGAVLDVSGWNFSSEFTIHDIFAL